MPVPELFQVPNPGSRETAERQRTGPSARALAHHEPEHEFTRPCDTGFSILKPTSLWSWIPRHTRRLIYDFHTLKHQIQRDYNPAEPPKHRSENLEDMGHSIRALR